VLYRPLGDTGREAIAPRRYRRGLRKLGCLDEVVDFHRPAGDEYRNPLIGYIDALAQAKVADLTHDALSVDVYKTVINKMLLKAETLMQVTPPAQDPASINFNRQLVGNGQDAGAFGYGKGHLLREQGYLTELVQRLNEALGNTTSSDQSATVSLNRATDHGIVL
jgi:hypothetical protein